MNLIELQADERRDDGIALLCANVYGDQAGLTPLVAYAGALTQWLPHHQARVLALSDDQHRLLCLALLVLEEDGAGAELKWLTTPNSLRKRGYARALVSRLTAHMQLKVVVPTEYQRWWQQLGFEYWGWRDSGERVGSTRHRPIEHATVMLDEVRLLQQFKTDRALFKRFARRFEKGLARTEFR